MSHLCNLITAFSLGAGLVYFLDPVSGRRRRALSRDQLIHGISRIRKSGDMADAKLRHLRNRAYGTYHEVRRDVRRVAEAATGSVESN